MSAPTTETISVELNTEELACIFVCLDVIHHAMHDGAWPTDQESHDVLVKISEQVELAQSTLRVIQMMEA